MSKVESEQAQFAFAEVIVAMRRLEKECLQLRDALAAAERERDGLGKSVDKLIAARNDLGQKYAALVKERDSIVIDRDAAMNDRDQLQVQLERETAALKLERDRLLKASERMVERIQSLQEQPAFPLPYESVPGKHVATFTSSTLATVAQLNSVKEELASMRNGPTAATVAQLNELEGRLMGEVKELLQGHMKAWHSS